MGLNHDVIADDLIHELFHASAQTDDVGYATDAVHASDSGQQLDVSVLLNLGAGCWRSRRAALTVMRRPEPSKTPTRSRCSPHC